MRTRFAPYSDDDNHCDWCSAPSEHSVCTSEQVTARGETRQRVQRWIACDDCAQEPVWLRLVARAVPTPEVG